MRSLMAVMLLLSAPLMAGQKGERTLGKFVGRCRRAL